MTPVLILSYNAIELLYKCIQSVREQDVETQLYVVDNGSTDGSTFLLEKEKIPSLCLKENVGVSEGWNLGLRRLFDDEGHSHVLVLNQDVVLIRSCVRELLAFQQPFVTCFPVEDEHEIAACTPEAEQRRREEGLTPYPCFSAFLISRECWNAVGEFDTATFGWAGDCDYHVRGHRAGVPMWKSKVPFLHHAGTTLRTASEAEREWFVQRANLDRAAFKAKWGCEPGQDGYGELFSPELFGIDLK